MYEKAQQIHGGPLCLLHLRSIAPSQQNRPNGKIRMAKGFESHQCGKVVGDRTPCFYQGSINNDKISIVYISLRRYNKVKHYTFREIFKMNGITTKETAEKWGVTPRQVQLLCARGRWLSLPK